MKLCLVLMVLVVGTLAAENYSNKFDDIDVDRILQNNRILTNYIKCMMEEGSCTAEGRELKKTLPDALASGCSKCNKKQKDTAEKVIDHLKANRPQDWNRLIAKYDPQGEYEKRFKATQAKKV
nr:chemosensory protein 6 [Gregopimpla kuwanae]